MTAPRTCGPRRRTGGWSGRLAWPGAAGSPLAGCLVLRDAGGVPGYFAPDSVAVRVMSNRAVGLTYGQRALFVGALNPRLY